jgi:hypothetical protein
LKAELLSLHASSQSGLVVLPRQALQDLDRACTRPLIWLSAVAGAGKSTLARGYAQQRQRPCLWLRFEGGELDAHAHSAHATARPESHAGAQSLARLAALTQGLAALCGMRPTELPRPATDADDLVAQRDCIAHLFDAVAGNLPQHAILVLDDVAASGQTMGHAPLLIDLLEMGLCRLPPAATPWC